MNPETLTRAICYAFGLLLPFGIAVAVWWFAV